MPEALTVVPPLQMPTENSSEVGSSSSAAETTDRSTDNRDLTKAAGANGKKLNAKFGNKHKLRKSNGRRIQKKPQLKPLTSEKKGISAVKLKSCIPRALVLTASSSNTSLATSDSLASPLIPVVKPFCEEGRLQRTTNNTSCLVRQKTAVILAYRQRKSVSQMDLSQARRQMNFCIASPSRNHQSGDNCDQVKTLMADKFCENMTVKYSNDSFVHKMYNEDYYLMPDRDPQIAGLRIFTTIMLNAWRKRRDEVRRLIDEIADLKRGAIKSKNQIHVLSSLFRVEQKRNDELNCQLKRSLEDINLTKCSCESLTSSLISLKADKALLEQQLIMKEQEYESINTFLAQTKSDLFKSMTVQRELQASLSTEQRNIQTLENQKNELINEICELNSEAMQKEADLREEIQEKCQELMESKTKLAAAEEQLKLLKGSIEQLLSEREFREEQMRQQVQALQNELKLMDNLLETSLGNRLKNYWNKSMTYQGITFQVLHWLVFYTLPATPPPKMKHFPFALCLDKVLSIVKR